VFTPEFVSLLHSGCGLIVGTVSRGGEPRATRAWGLHVTDPAQGVVRILIDADDGEVVDNLAATGALAITGSDVATLQSVQLKGTVAAMAPLTDDDRRYLRDYCDQFFAAVLAIDGIAGALMEGMVPTELVACEVVVSHMFDQSPGPSAGLAIASP
jgi:hypothetical protein